LFEFLALPPPSNRKPGLLHSLDHRRENMEISYDYTKKRKDFALPFQFSDTPTQLLQSIDPNKKDQSNWTQRAATTLEFDCVPDVAEMKVL
jgi:hypothetical protein